MTRIIEMNEMTLEPKEFTQEEWDEQEKYEQDEECGWTTKRIWQIDEDTRIVESRGDHNHLSIVGYFINEAESRERRAEAITCVYTAFTMLLAPKGGNF